MRVNSSTQTRGKTVIPDFSTPRFKETSGSGTDAADARSLYFSLLNPEQFSSSMNSKELKNPANLLISPELFARTRDFLEKHLHDIDNPSVEKNSFDSDEFPISAAALPDWIESGTTIAGQRYRAYVEQRQAGARRRYFPTRSHALNFLNAVAPTKLVDGAWLYGLTAHWHDPRLQPLLRIYLEELGDGDPALNHVRLYRQLLAHEDCDSPELLSADHYVQGALQLALAYHAEEFLPEVIGFNLGYEQLPLHLLITAYELRELGIDPFYFTLHITIDNSHSGHARKALQGLLNLLPQGGAEANEFMQRVKRGAALNARGIGSTKIIESFDLHATLVRILVEKSRVGKYLHGDYCRVGGRTVTDWLQNPENMPQFLLALENTGWIRRGEPVERSRFWQLVQGEKAKMFGVFTAYEQQVLRDWITGENAVQELQRGQLRPLHSRQNVSILPDDRDKDLSGDLYRLRKSLSGSNDIATTMQLLRPWLAPDRHHSVAGLYATRTFSQLLD